LRIEFRDVAIEATEVFKKFNKLGSLVEVVGTPNEDSRMPIPTSREKAIPGALKWLIPGAFWFASNLYAGGNAYRWRIL
jgi:hypothetical protein